MTCKHGVLPSKQCCAGCAELDNTLYRCNQEIIKQTYRAEQAEAQCAEIATAYQNMKGDFEHWAYCELIDSPPGKRCTCGVWELVAAIEAALEGKP